MCFCDSYQVYPSIVSPCTQSLKISDPQVPRVRAISRFFFGSMLGTIKSLYRWCQLNRLFQLSISHDIPQLGPYSNQNLGFKWIQALSNLSFSLISFHLGISWLFIPSFPRFSSIVPAPRPAAPSAASLRPGSPFSFFSSAASWMQDSSKPKNYH